MNRNIKTFSCFLLLIAAFATISFFNGVGNNIAFAEPKGISIEGVTPESNDLGEPEEYQVQAVLNAQRTAVISGGMDGVLKRIPFENGDTFKKGEVLVEYNCRFENARHREVHAELTAVKRQAEAYERLREQNSVAEVEYISVLQEYKKLKAVLDQTIARLELCRVKAPFDGRVTDKVSNNHEAVRSGRVLLEISSIEPLQAELIGADLKIVVHETGKSYGAKIKRIHGKVDPVTQTAYVIAEINRYEEALLPGMSGRAIFDTTPKRESLGFLGVKITADE